MIPRSISATALDTSITCMARYAAEHIHRAKSGSGTAALVGTAVHGGLETYVQEVYIDGKAEPSLDRLVDHYKMSYVTTFDTTDMEGEFYEDGLDLTKVWFGRTDLTGVKVLSVEQKYTFDVVVPDDTGTAIKLPFNYVWDRCDELEEEVYRVVDYKTIRWGYSPEQLKKKTQARMYGLAAQIRFPNAKRIWVQFDLLRHDTVGVVYTYEENKQSWLWLKDRIKKILDTDVANVPETINADCKWCPRKAACGTLAAHEKSKTTISMSTEDLVNRRLRADLQMKALKSLMDETDMILGERAKTEDVLEFDSGQARAFFTRSKKRVIDSGRVEQVIGPQLFAQWGKKDITIGNIDRLLKGDQLNAEQKIKLKGLISTGYGEPYIKSDVSKGS